MAPNSFLPAFPTLVINKDQEKDALLKQES
jgi:hypothetical protein